MSINQLVPMMIPTAKKKMAAQASMPEIASNVEIADMEPSVVKLAATLFRVAGKPTKNVVHHFTLLPVASVTQVKLKAFETHLANQGWTLRAHAKYKGPFGATEFSLAMTRDDPDASGFNAVRVSSETCVMCLQLFKEIEDTQY